MPLYDQLRRWYGTEHNKLQRMNLRQKAGYILRYYRAWILGLAALALLGFYIGDAVLQSQKENVLQGFFTNDSWGLFDAPYIEKTYGETLSLTRNQRVVFDDALYIDMGGNANTYTEASNAKVLAYTTTRQLDFIISTAEVRDFYADHLPMKDLSQILPKDTFAALADQLISITDENGETIYTGLDMTGCRYVAGVGADTDPAVTDTYVLFAPKNAPHEAALADFIAYCFELPRS